MLLTTVRLRHRCITDNIKSVLELLQPNRALVLFSSRVIIWQQVWGTPHTTLADIVYPIKVPNELTEKMLTFHL